MTHSREEVAIFASVLKTELLALVDFVDRVGWQAFLDDTILVVGVAIVRTDIWLR
jgi:hypothetical protein